MMCELEDVPLEGAGMWFAEDVLMHCKRCDVFGKVSEVVWDVLTKDVVRCVRFYCFVFHSRCVALARVNIRVECKLTVKRKKIFT